MQVPNTNNKSVYVRQSSSSSRLDWQIVLTIFFFMVIGFISLALSFYTETGNIPIRTMFVQVIWWAIGWAFALILMRIDADGLYKIAPYTYGAGIFLLIAILFLYDRGLAASTGARSWFSFAGFTFQPSEVMKPAYILMMSKIIFEHNSKYKIHTYNLDFKLILQMGLYTVPILVLMLLQRDFGSSLVFVAIFFGMLFVSGILNRIIIPVVIGITILGSLVLTMVTTVWGRSILLRLGFQNYQFARIDSWLDPSGDSSASSFQLMQSIKAIGSGQLVGNGPNNMKVHVPVRSSDMIFSSIGEAFGFVGGLLIIGGYFYLIYLLFKRVFQTQNSFYAYMATGVVMLILFHVFENIGMTIGLLPLTGIPLPFISQGGSALLGNMIAIGLTMSMTYHNFDSKFSTRKTSFNA